MTYSKKLAAAAGLALALVSSTVALPAMAMQETQIEAAQTYDDATLTRFVAAAQDVNEVRLAYAPKVQAAENEADAKALAEEARAEMKEAVEAVEGMDVQTYIQIGEAARADKALAGRITEIAQGPQGAVAQ